MSEFLKGLGALAISVLIGVTTSAFGAWLTGVESDPGSIVAAVLAILAWQRAGRRAAEVAGSV